MSTSQSTPRGGPTTEAGKAISSKNAVTHGLFATSDFIRPGEEPIYSELAESLHAELAPDGSLELNLVDEIRRAMWRLRRCGLIEEGFSKSGATDPMQIDPMQDESTARLQLSVDRARGLSHRLLHKCTVELRKLQTERQFRNEYFKAGTDLAWLGVCDFRSVRKSLDQQETANWRNQKAELAVLFGTPSMPPDAATSSFCKTDSEPVQTPRNANCPCKSGLKYKRCCGKNSPAVLNVTRKAA